MGCVTVNAGGAQSTILVKRPKFKTLWAAYPFDMTPEEVYKVVGGNVYEHYVAKPSGYANACGVRLSRAFNYGGFSIKKGPGAYKLKGDDGKAYIMRVNDMITFVEQRFGESDLPFRKFGLLTPEKLKGKQGVIIFVVSGWRGATGHVTLWNGKNCSDSCYFIHHQPGVVTTEVKFWELK